MNTIPTLNDGSAALPALRVYLNLDTLKDLPKFSQGPRGGLDEQLTAVWTAGYEGIQSDALAATQAPARELGLGATVTTRINTTAEVLPRIKELRSAGWDAATVHVGWGHESDGEADALLSQLVDASAGEGFPIYVETHRATLTQDSWRTVQFVERHPGLRFNADFSHWYTGLEMPYGGFETKLKFIAPVLERVRFFHGRVGNASHIQVPLDDPSMGKALAHYRQMWTAAMVGFLRNAVQGDYLVFAPELLQPAICYARTPRRANGKYVEESDRWLEALSLGAIARECFSAAVVEARSQ